MPPQTPYTKALGDREPIAAMQASGDRFRQLLGGWTPAQFERTYAPGKWTARQILIHLAQTELALGNRARMALSTSPYTAQAMNQDQWMTRDEALSGREAIDAFAAIAAMNRSMFQALSAADRATPFTHPEYGELTIDWLIHQMAGHQIHHLQQLERITPI